MKRFLTKTLMGAAGAAAITFMGASASFTAHAATPDSWYFGSGAGGDGKYPSSDRRYVSSQGLGVTISGWYGNETGSGNLTNANGALRHWGGGLGLNRQSDNHTLDNNGVQDELIAFHFDEAVALTDVRFGWYENDSDATILYQNNATAGFSGLGSTSISNLTNNGYSLLGNLLNPETNNSTVQGSTSSSFSGPSQAGPIYSKVWLVGAYLQGVTGNSSFYAGAWDSVKLHTLVATRMPGGQVPVPATIALFTIGLFVLRKRVAQPGSTSVMIST